MTTESKLMIAETIGEGLIGGAIGVVVVNNILPECDNKHDKVLVTAGGIIVSWLLGRKFAKEFYEWGDAVFDTDMSDNFKK